MKLGLMLSTKNDFFWNFFIKPRTNSTNNFGFSNSLLEKIFVYQSSPSYLGF